VLGRLASEALVDVAGSHSCRNIARATPLGRKLCRDLERAPMLIDEVASHDTIDAANANSGT
jgi:hypothetical protein